MTDAHFSFTPFDLFVFATIALLGWLLIASPIVALAHYLGGLRWLYSIGLGLALSVVIFWVLIHYRS